MVREFEFKTIDKVVRRSSSDWILSYFMCKSVVIASYLAAATNSKLD